MSFIAFLLSLGKACRLDRPWRRKDVLLVIIRQIHFTGLQAFRFIVVGASLIAAMVIAQSGPQLTNFGGTDALAPLLVGAFMRELGPMLTVIVVIARSISAIASELSSMRANGEIDGLAGAGVSPLSYLVFPRVVAGSFAILFLAMHFVWIALLVSFIGVQFFIDVPFYRFIDGLGATISFSDLMIFFLKTFTLGFVSVLVACYCGLRTTGATFEIPQATTRAVVWSFTFCFVTQILISALYYFVVLKESILGAMI